MSPPEAKEYGIIDAVYASIGAPLGSKGGGTAGTDTADTSEGPSTEKGPEAATE
jgi:hypothetical protein